MVKLALVLLSAAFTAVNACSSTTTTTPTSCPTTAAGSTTCASGSSCVPSTNVCSDTTKTCLSNNQFQMCSGTTSGTAPNFAQTVKLCLGTAGLTCTTFFTSGFNQLATPAPNTYDTFAACCAALTPTANVRYDILPGKDANINPTQACFLGQSSTPYIVGTATAGDKFGYCVRFPHTANAAPDVIATAVAVAASPAAYSYTSFASCCVNIQTGAAAAVPQTTYGSVTQYGLALELCKGGKAN